MSSKARAIDDYRLLNRVLCAVILAGLAWPLALPWMDAILPPALRTCGSLRWFGRPCPMCGLTRGLGALLRGDPAQAQAWNPLAIPVFCLLVFELAYRSWAALKPLRPETRARVARLDGRLHAAAAIAYLAYAAVFIWRVWLSQS